MPSYDYQCRNCGHRIEVLHGVNATGPTACERCGGPMRKLLSTPNIVFKGSGWAKKDARDARPSSRSSASASKSESTGSTGDAGDSAGGSSGGDSDTKGDSGTKSSRGTTATTGPKKESSTGGASAD